LVFHLGQPVHQLRGPKGGKGPPVLRGNVSGRFKQVRPVTDQTGNGMVGDANFGRYARNRHTGRMHAGDCFLLILWQI
jgi:hypothetical protein